MLRSRTATALKVESLADDLRVHGYRASVDERDETLGRRIRDMGP